MLQLFGHKNDAGYVKQFLEPTAVTFHSIFDSI